MGTATANAKANEADDTGLVSLLPLGVTVKVYEVPTTSPATVQFCEPLSALALATVQFRPDGVETTLKLVPIPSALNVTVAFVDVPT